MNIQETADVLAVGAFVVVIGGLIALDPLIAVIWLTSTCTFTFWRKGKQK